MGNLCWEADSNQDLDKPPSLSSPAHSPVSSLCSCIPVSSDSLNLPLPQALQASSWPVPLFPAFPNLKSSVHHHQKQVLLDLFKLSSSEPWSSFASLLNLTPSCMLAASLQLPTPTSFPGDGPNHDSRDSSPAPSLRSLVPKENPPPAPAPGGGLSHILSSCSHPAHPAP